MKIPSMQKFWTPSGSPWTTSDSLLVPATHLLFVKQLSKFPTSNGKISVVSKESRTNSVKPFNILLNIPRNSSNSVFNRRRVFFSMDLLVLVKHFWQRLLQMNVLPISSVSRDLNYS